MCFSRVLANKSVSLIRQMCLGVESNELQYVHF